MVLLLQQAAAQSVLPANTASKLSAWFEREKEASLSPAEVKERRAWWDALHPEVRTSFLRCAELDGFGKGYCPLDAELVDIVALKKLYVEADSLKSFDVACLKPMSGLEDLELSGFKLKGLEGLSGFKHLLRLGLNNLRLSEQDLAVVSSLRRLEGLALVDAGVKNGDALRHLVNLRELNLNANGLSDLGFLKGLQKLEVLQLGDNGIDKPGPISGLTKLRELDLAENKIADLGFLVALTSIEVLDLHLNCFAEIEALANLEELRELNISGPFAKGKVGSLKALAGLAKLEDLDFSSHGKITDVSPLATCASLRRIAARVIEPMNGLPSLVGLKHLKRISDKRCFKRADVKEFAAQRKDVELA